MSETAFLDRVDFAARTGEDPNRGRAAEVFRAHGWPTRADEAWHYTDLRASLRSFDLTLPTHDAPDIGGMIPRTATPKVIFVNGRFDESLSALPHFVRRFDHRAAARADRALPLVSLNAAVANDGIQIDVSGGTDAGTLFLISGTDTPSQDMLAPFHRIAVGAGGSLTLIEVIRGAGRYMHNVVVEIALAEGAVLRHYRLQDESIDAVNVTTALVDLREGARYEAFTLNCGAKLSRYEAHVTLSGPNADVHLNAAQLLAGTQHGDITTVVAHRAPHCASRQTVKSVLAGSARGVFQGRIEVAQQAQKTDGYQMNQALLLSPDAEIDTKPELEIFADDVKCSHGATIGAIDPEQMFYLRSRGIPEADARAMLIRAFLDEALEPVTDEEARSIFEAAIDVWWQKGVL
ncbi:Fe-S cluster assembly protein SufD [Acidiphilium sp. PA]|uniref:Fe-S cluster assembly protein SufD n=1 Tax=Acidiphilium sp. PA TaxID=2871705 RepID=UPI0022449F5A|nr:Fe-S cluster assembly protein SufD [Acidiphilium sp. PA]MCW8308132.1 Fe-S cluster assembly protein SufD [Acidiphilium sp. PA]